MDELLQELQTTWHTEIPISKAMGIEVVSFENNRLTVQAALGPNVNVHGTAFAGSLYAICALCGWGSTWLQLKQNEINGSIVIADGHIHYQRPVAEDIIVVCDFNGQSDALNILRDDGKTRFNLQCDISVGDKQAAGFEGVYAVKSLA
ncbi:MAG: YiiD C-terminal domain-containing protein [Pseudomonadota bacterium]